MLELIAEARTAFGKALKKERAAGRMPVVVYGAKDQAAPYFVDTKNFRKVLSVAGESSIVAFKAGTTKKDVLIHDVDFHPVSGEPIHADLYVVEANKPIEVDVPLEFIGVAPAVKELGGALVKVMRELKIEALPKDLPHNIEIDISGMDALDSQIKVGDLKLPKGVTAIDGEDEVVVAMGAAGEEVKEEDATVDLSAIEVEEKGKKPEEGEAGAEAAE